MDDNKWCPGGGGGGGGGVHLDACPGGLEGITKACPGGGWGGGEQSTSMSRVCGIE